MPIKCPEARREYQRAYDLANPRPRTRMSERIEGQDEKWFVLTCLRCFGMFDVPASRGALAKYCPDCKR